MHPATKVDPEQAAKKGGSEPFSDDPELAIKRTERQSKVAFDKKTCS